jgi:FKBP-type peptidyl-prolyl cis-trans isomerase
MKFVALALFVLSLIASTAFADSESASLAIMVTTASGLQYADDVIGDGEIAKKGDTVTLQYTGWIQQADGSKGLNSIRAAAPVTRSHFDLVGSK